jgi:hypothetical protein
VNCKECESRLSDHLDASLPPAERARVAAHLRACAACSSAWKALRASVALLRKSGRDEPPHGLEDAILQTIAASPVAVVTVPRASGSYVAALRRVAAVLLVTVAIVALVLERTRSRGFEDRALAAEDRLSRLRLETDGERARILAELADAADKVRAAGEEASREREALASETVTRQGLEARLTLLEDSLRDERARIADLEVRIADCSTEAARLALQTVEQPRVKPPPRSRSKPRAEPRSGTVAVRRYGGRLEIETSGPRDEVVPKLLDLARGDPDPEVSSLALSRVESLLEAGRPPIADDPESKAGVKQWFQRRASGLSSMTPPFLAASTDVAEDGDAVETEQSARLRRLNELELLWNSIRKGSS